MLFRLFDHSTGLWTNLVQLWRLSKRLLFNKALLCDVNEKQLVFIICRRASMLPNKLLNTDAWSVKRRNFMHKINWFCHTYVHMLSRESCLIILSVSCKKERQKLIWNSLIIECLVKCQIQIQSLNERLCLLRQNDGKSIPHSNNKLWSCY